MNPSYMSYCPRTKGDTFMCTVYKVEYLWLMDTFQLLFFLCQSSWHRGVFSHSVTRSSCQANLGPSLGIIPNGKQYNIPNSDRKFPKLCLKNDHFIVIFWKLIFLSCMSVFFVLFYLFLLVYFWINFFTQGLVQIFLTWIVSISIAMMRRLLKLRP